VFEDLVDGVSKVNEVIERHDASLHVRVVESPVHSADALEAWRSRGRGEGRHQVVLWRIGEDRIEVMKVLRDQVSIGLDEVKSRIDKLPLIVADGLTLEGARTLAEALRETGSDVTIALI
jgi:ribosomal protein L7/L12